MRTLHLTSVKEVAKMLRQMRKDAGMTLREVAERSERSVSFVSEVERGLATPSLETIDLLAAVYGYDMAIVFEHL